ncbi:MAG: type III-A CRISPR-associated RAMP protein Csm4 [Chloroflexota bacterium]
MKAEIWHIIGKGFHFGRHGLGQEESGIHLTSDTLFAALVSRLAEVQGSAAVQPWMDQFIQSPPLFVLSSAFPRAGEVRFFPVPLGRLEKKNDGGKEEVHMKTLKRVRYVSEKTFQKIIAGESLNSLIQSGCLLQGGQVLLVKEEMPLLPKKIAAEEQPIWQVNTRPRVTIGRVDSTSNIFFTGWTAFNQDCGLWFGVRWLRESDEAKKTLATLLADLGTAGIGGDRSSGFGDALFEKQAAGCMLPDAAASRWVTLSHYLPAQDENNALLDKQAAYSLETVGGWIYSPASKNQRRISVRMLAEGSVFGSLEKDVPGQLVDVQPVYEGLKPLGHPVWRNGQAFAVGLNTGKEEA